MERNGPSSKMLTPYIAISDLLAVQKLLFPPHAAKIFIAEGKSKS
ncbi:hypothetical protein COLO4_30937 [Corchorus olitorius]|uniref:Uncharacterized protein n=1 Tax=Corchorus olitorius TaxID=93759 RepID=A0A1R3H6A4_9ROSI|nr:hypothetical protein COLO4_30937 [Corchorus olitorius]